MRKNIIYYRILEVYYRVGKLIIGMGTYRVSWNIFFFGNIVVALHFVIFVCVCDVSYGVLLLIRKFVEIYYALVESVGDYIGIVYEYLIKQYILIYFAINSWPAQFGF